MMKRKHMLVCMMWIGWTWTGEAAIGQAVQEFEVPVAVRGVSIHRPGAETIENGTILMSKGRIIAIGTDIPLPPHVEIVDAEGLHAYPGFVAALTHLGIADEKRSKEERRLSEDADPDPTQRAFAFSRAAHRRGVRPEFRTADHYAPKAGDLKAYRKQGFASAVVAPRHGIFAGQSCVVSLSDDPRRRVILSEVVGQHASFSAGEPGDYPRTLLGVFALFRQVLLDTQWWTEQRDYFMRHPNAKRPAVDRSLESLESLVAGDARLIFEANTENEIHRALNLAEEFNLPITISGAKEAFKVVDRLKAGSVSLIVSLKFPEEPELGAGNSRSRRKPLVDDPHESQTESEAGEVEAPDEQRTSATDDDGDDEKRIYEPLKLRRERRRLWEEKVENVIRLHEAGLTFSFSMRDFDSPAEFGKGLHKVIERGLPVDAALAALTQTPADFLGLSGRVGDLDVGFLANVVVTTAPLEDGDVAVRYVFTEGDKHEFEVKKQGKSKNKVGQQDDEGSADEPDDGGPRWACEIEADRAKPIETGGNIILRNATVLTVTGPDLPDADVLIRGGKIASVGSNVTAPAGTTEFDATGLYVTPGLVDCHSHLGIDAVNESPLAVSAEVRIADVINPGSVAIYRAAAGGTTTHHSMHGSANPIGGENVVFKLKYDQPVSDLLVPDAPRTIKWALGENVKQSNWANSHGKRFPNGRMGVESAIRDALVAARAYGEEWERYNRLAARGDDVLRPRRDLRLEALWKTLQGEIWVHTHCYRSDEMTRLMHIAEDFGIRIGVLQHVLEGYRIGPEIARHGASASTFSNFWAYKIEAFDAIPHNAAVMTDHGINVSVNSDSPNTIRYLNLEAAKSIKWGNMRPREALKLVTINPAIQLGVDHRVGSIEVGKDGDVAVFNGHPLNTYSRNVMTVIDGDVYFQADDMRPNPLAREIAWNKRPEMSLVDKSADVIAIVGGTVHTVSGDAIEGGTVVIRDGKIDAVDRGISVPSSAKTINATGQHVYPGLIDAGGRLGLYEIGSLRATRDDFDIATFAPELRAVDAVHPHSVHVAIARAAGITMQLSRPTGGTISGQAGLIDLDGWTLDQMVREAEAGLFMNVPSLPARLTGDEKSKKKRRDDHETAMKELEAFLQRATNYANAVDAADRNNMMERPVLDRRLAAMRPYLRGGKPVMLNANQYKQILDAIAFAEKHNLSPIIYGGREAWKLAGELAEKNVPVILNSVLSLPGGRYEAYDSVYRCASVLQAAGVKWCLASGSATNVYDLPFNAGMAVAYGVTEEQAIRAMTLSAAEILGVGDQLGSIAVGKKADLIITTLPPTQVAAHVSAVLIDGRIVDMSNKHSEDLERSRNRPMPQLPPAKRLKGPPSFSHRD